MEDEVISQLIVYISVIWMTIIYGSIIVATCQISFLAGRRHRLAAEAHRDRYITFERKHPSSSDL
jgi:hypothetical protein